MEKNLNNWKKLIESTNHENVSSKKESIYNFFKDYKFSKNFKIKDIDYFESSIRNSFKEYIIEGGRKIFPWVVIYNYKLNSYSYCDLF